MKVVRLTFLLLFTLLFLGKNNAQGVDSKLAEALQHTLDSMHQGLDIYGLGAAVQLPNDAVWAGGSGVSTLSPLDSITHEHAFETGSSSKTITAACVLQLVDEGMLNLDDSLHQWLPDFQNLNPNITIRQLLRHQSGVFDILGNPNFNVAMGQNLNQIWAFEDLITDFLNPPAFQPGAGWGYSNTNYILLGMIVETATGNAFHQELADRFFTPMGLGSYANPAYSPLPEPSSHLWLDLTGDGELNDAFYFLTNQKSLFSAVDPAGGYFAKPSDLAQWVRASMSGSLHSPETWAEATETVNTPQPGGTKYGLGLSTRSFLGLTGYGHGGDLAGYTTQAFYFPEKDISIVVCGNDASIISWNLASTVQALLKVYLDCEDSISPSAEAALPEASLTVFPNPFSDKMTVEVSSVRHLGLSLTNLTGQVVWEQSADNSAADPRSAGSAELNGLGHLPAGIYFLNAVLDGRAIRPVKVSKVK